MSMATRTDTQTPALRDADSHDVIRVHGARVNNLKDVSLEGLRPPPRVQRIRAGRRPVQSSPDRGHDAKES